MFVVFDLVVKITLSFSLLEILISNLFIFTKIVLSANLIFYLIYIPRFNAGNNSTQSFSSSAFVPFVHTMYPFLILHILDGIITTELLMVMITILNICLLLVLQDLKHCFSVFPYQKNKIVDVRSYALIRHPIYTIHLTSLFFVLSSSLDVYNLVYMIPYFFLTGIRINKEEKYLSSGRAYNVYKEKVPFKLLPFVY